MYIESFCFFLTEISKLAKTNILKNTNILPISIKKEISIYGTLFQQQVVDNITIRATIKPPPLTNESQRDNFYWLGQEFYPLFKQGHHDGFCADVDGLRLTYSILKRTLTIQNSLHKFLKGNNYSDFNFSEIQQAIQKLEDGLGLNLQNAQCLKEEHGINIEANESTYKNCVSYKGKPFTSMKTRTGRIYGADNEWTNMKIKVYDKTFQVKTKDGLRLPTSIVRYEIVGKNDRYFNSFGVDAIRTVKDFANRKKIGRLGLDLLQKWDLIEKGGDRIDLSGLSSTEIKTFAVMVNPLTKEVYRTACRTKDRNGREVDGSSYERANTFTNKINRRIISSNLNSEIRSKMEEKIGELLAN